MKTIQTDCLVIGSGLAGSAFAYLAAKRGLDCVLINGEPNIAETNSNMAQGGIIYEPSPDFDLLLKDINTAACGISNPSAVRALTETGFKTIKDVIIDELKTKFDTSADGKISFTKEGAHSKPRIIYAKDNTGEVMLNSVHSALKKTPNVKILAGHTAANLLTLSHSSPNPLDRYKPLTCFGAYILDEKTGEVIAATAKKTILATGGAGQLYKYTTNHNGALGQGISMAYRIGARVMNMEYMQFHPTVFYKKGGEMFLISETARGEGGILIDGRGNAFMEKYHPLKSLAPRDIISRAIHDELLKSGDDCVYIDMSAMPKDKIKQRFPNIYAKCLAQGVDITAEPIPVTPSAHYFCGGIYAEPDGTTNINNLCAIGECSCTGFHGANRLASTSLLECLAMAQLCAQKSHEDIKSSNFYIPKPKEWESPAKMPDIDLIKQDLQTIKNTMWNYVGIARSKKRLGRALQIMRQLSAGIDEFYRECRLTKELLDLRSAALCATLIIYAAERNTASLGCHFIEND